MLVSRRVTQVAEIGARIETHALVHSAYRLHVVHNANVVCDDALFLPSFERRGRIDRPVLTVIIAGRARIRAHGRERWLEAGDFAVVDSKSAVEMRQEGADYQSLVFEWDAGSLGSAPGNDFDAGRLSPKDHLRLGDGARAFAAAANDVGGAASFASRALSVLHASGAPVDACDAGALVESVSAKTRALSSALDAVLSNLAAGPAVIDLDRTLALSDRQIQRVVSSFNERYGFNAFGWRDTRNRRRLMVGAALMTAPGAVTERVSAITGYASPTSLCHAFAQAGLVSPGAMAAAAAGLR